VTEIDSREYAVGSIRRAIREVIARRRGRLAAALVALFVAVGALADVLASDLPIACEVAGVTYVLPCITHPSGLVGWNNARIVDATRTSGWVVRPIVAWGPGEESALIAAPPFSSPGHPFGTDQHGRDVFARLVHGTRTALGVSGLAVATFVAIGAVLGAAAGFFGRRVDAIVARLIDVLSSFPALVLLVVVQALQERPSFISLLVAIGLTRWTEVARVTRAEVLVVSARDYTLAARALGATPSRVLWRHVLPNAKGPILVSAALGLGQVVVIESSLSFLRVGLPPPAASWGEMLSEMRDGPSAWWLVVLPGVLVVVLSLALNVIGETLRDGFDPRARIA
jgi:peptide/nickel transport system permease protein